ncbi:MAG: hypothetical protein DRN68_04955 [Thaumarchaeota archaeon]|nr:MAG: hypothetical protein DRN68_04955 [Nitrososphaerota archaeon]
MTRRRWLFAAMLALLALVLAGCYERGHDYFVDTGADTYGWTKRMGEAFWDDALKRNYLTKNEDGTYSIDPSVVSVEDVYVVVDQVLEDIAWVLSPDRSASWRALLLGMPSLKEGFEREEQKWLYIKSQLAKVLVYQDFLELLGKTMKEAAKAYKSEELVPKNTEFIYEPEYLRRAKEDGTLQVVEQGMYYVYTPYGYKLPDPSARDDPNAFLWEPKLEGYWVVSYAISNGKEPQDLSADFAEIYRAKVVDGRIVTETEPCVRAYRKLSGSTLRVIVIDWDHEGEPGYGAPDEVQEVYASTGWKLITEKETLFEELARPRSAEIAAERNLELPPLELKIVRLGSVEEYKGEYKEDGWAVPYEYKDEHNINYTTYLVFEDLPEDYPFKRIAYVVKAWNQATVYEYWVPKPEYAVDMEYAYSSGRNIVVQPVGGARQEISAHVASGQLHKIVYKYGDTWIEIVDLDGTGVLQYKIEGVARPSFSTSSSSSYKPPY